MIRYNKLISIVFFLVIVSIGVRAYSIDLSSSNANLTIYGKETMDSLGKDIASGDVNGDGIDDLIISIVNDGKVFVIYGRKDYGSNIIVLDSIKADLTIIEKNAGDSLGSSLAVGDINSDGIGDIIIGAGTADPLGRINAGEAYVIYGSSNYGTNKIIDLDLVRANVTVRGANTSGPSGLGESLASGDVNNDGIADIITSSTLADPLGGINAGEVYVIYGSKNYEDNKIIDLYNNEANITIRGANVTDRLGVSLAAGDVNGDGISDIITSAYLADPLGGSSAGEVYVIYGSSNYGTNKVIDLDKSMANLTIRGNNSFDQLGFSVASGDINNDGKADIIAGANGADSSGENSGEVYVVFGRDFKNNVIDLNVEMADITVIADDPSGQLGYSLSAGDVNEDGIDDIIIGANEADQVDEVDNGKIYAIYGSTGHKQGKIINLDKSSASLTIIGDKSFDRLGSGVMVGDINNDGKDDIIGGAIGVNLNGINDVGAIYVIYGRNFDLTNPAGKNLPPQVQKPTPFKTLFSGLFFLIFRR